MDIDAVLSGIKGVVEGIVGVPRHGGEEPFGFLGVGAVAANAIAQHLATHAPGWNFAGSDRAQHLIARPLVPGCGQRCETAL